jgi:hypothetical protein
MTERGTPKSGDHQPCLTRGLLLTEIERHPI